MAMPADKAPKLSYGVCDNLLTGLAGLPAIAALARILGLPWALQKHVRIKVRQRGCSDAQNLLSLIFALCTGGGHLNTVDALAADEAACEGVGLPGAVPDSRRLGEYLARFSAKALDGLQACVRSVSAQVVPVVAAACGKELGYVPVFIDGTGIEVQGKQFEGAAVGYNGERQYWLHSVFVGRAWVSARLNEGGTDVKGDFAEQLAADVDGLDLGAHPVWARADAAYYCEAFVKECKRRGWDYSVSVTDPNKKAPVLRVVEAMELDLLDWEPLDAQGVERAVTVAYRPGTWAEEQVYVVIRRDRDGSQELLEPVFTVILVSRDDLRVGELVRRHRAKQGQENAFKGPLTELGLHHPPCQSYAANQAFYWCGQIAQLLLLMLQYQVLPEAARQHGLGPLIRHFVRSVGRLQKRARGRRLLFATCNYRLGWLLRAGRIEPG